MRRHVLAQTIWLIAFLFTGCTIPPATPAEQVPTAASASVTTEVSTAAEMETPAPAEGSGGTRTVPTPTVAPVSRPTPASTPVTGSDPVILFTGDSRPGCEAGGIALAALLDTLPPAWPILFSGDATTTGDEREFAMCFDITFGRHKARMLPIPGNHEYRTPGGAGYFKYFGELAGEAGKGYYSFNVGSWHIIALNTEISHGAGSPQEEWLKEDLVANPALCTIAYWHEPRWSSGEHANDSSVGPIWSDLYEANVELALNGHDHDYERFAPQTPSGKLDIARGIREFVVGTGGVELRDFGSVQPNSEARDNETWGALKLTLHASGYDWEFLPVAGGSFRDSGSGPCH